MKKALLILFTISILLVLGSCGNTMLNSVKTEDEIKSDLEQRIEMYSTYPMQIQNVSILRRQTNSEEKKDIVYVSVDSTSDFVSRTDCWIIEYGYYDDIGWDYNNIDTYYDGDTSFTIINGPSEDTINSWFETFNLESGELPYSEWTVDSIDIFDTSATVSCTAKSSYTLPGLGVEVNNEEVVEINFSLLDYGTYWDSSIDESNYFSGVSKVTFSSPISATLYGDYPNATTSSTGDEEYKFEIKSIDITYENSIPSIILDADCEAYRFVSYGSKYKNSWNNFVFTSDNLSILRDKIYIGGSYTCDFAKTIFSYYGFERDVEAWYDYDYEVEESTINNTFAIILSPDSSQFNIWPFTFTA